MEGGEKLIVQTLRIIIVHLGETRSRFSSVFSSFFGPGGLDIFFFCRGFSSLFFFDETGRSNKSR